MMVEFVRIFSPRSSPRKHMDTTKSQLCAQRAVYFIHNCKQLKIKLNYYYIKIICSHMD